MLVTVDSPSAAGGTIVESGGETYYSVSVEIGTSDSNYIEILSGLQEGDTVAYIPTSASEGFGGMMPGGMGGEMPGGMGGGMPGGGPGGGPGGF